MYWDGDVHVLWSLVEGDIATDASIVEDGVQNHLRPDRCKKDMTIRDNMKLCKSFIAAYSELHKEPYSNIEFKKKKNAFK